MVSHLHAKDEAGEPIRVPVVCRCVAKAGGVRNVSFNPETLDPRKLAAKLTESYAGMTPEQRAEIAQRLRDGAGHENMPETAREAMTLAADQLAAMTAAEEAPDVIPVL